MVVFSFRSDLRTGQDWLDQGLRDLYIHGTGDAARLYGASGPGGGIGYWQLAAGAPALLSGQRPFTSGESQAANGRIFGLEDGLVTGRDATGLVGIVPDPAGVGSAAYWRGGFPLPDDITALADTGEGFVYLADGAGGAIRYYGLADDGGLTGTGTLRGTAEAYRGAITDLDMVSVSGQRFLLATDADGRGVSSYLADMSTGALDPRGMMGAGQGLGVMTPVALETASLGGSVYAVLASGSSGGGALSVMRLREDGYLQPVDHVLDTRATRFGQVQDLAVVAAGDRAYVLASGGDDGLSLFVMLQTGRLVHLQSIAEGAMPGVFGADRLAAIRTGDEIQVFLAAADQGGVAQLGLSIAGQGTTLVGTSAGEELQGGVGDDILIGGAGDDYLTARDGDDILVDGPGQDTLTGGGGADIYVLDPDGQRDRIRKFEPGIDRLDLSAFPMLYDPAQLGYTRRADGAELAWRGEVTEVLSLSGQPLTLEDIFGGDFGGPDRPPLGTGARMIGGDGSDRLEGNWGADSLEGQAGHDVIRGRDGDDQLFGGPGFDTLFGDTGADRLWGGNGRDLAYLGAGDDIFFDNGQTGEFGSDTVWSGAGNDTVEGGAGADVFYGVDGNDVVFGRLGPDRIYGGSGFDTLFGGNGADRLWGGDGRDRAYLGAGDDIFFDNGQTGEFGSDTVWSGAGNDTVEGGAGADVFYGMEGDDVIFGRRGADLLFGGAGNDTLEDGPGSDRLWGGGGADVFVFVADGEADRIADFTPGEDVIRLSGIDGGFAGLDIAAVGGALRIAAAGDVLWLEGVGADVLTADDFLFL